ncbi:urease accessory protein [Aphanothece hegewaldii CCALA 016]|uniref:Urease accessory protein UreD n=1 Tax=Aphanothece hegewaldii CCALA 016 TaxID=2107694 RepID=A0A2T1M179_9CHRO|nr:urease accessory protein UreD [Aphanothece hegewaldii]PSF38359.1 urease accessory protein [Aphanothece hegewaldii CCALA 016]
MTRWHGDLNLVYSYQTDTTLLTHRYTKAPLKIQRSFYPEGKEICHSVLLHTAGGVVGGDELTQTIHLQPHAKTLITTAAAAKIYRSNGQIATQKISLQLEENACLEWLPQETIIFDGAVYQQDIRVDLGQNATFLAWDITRLGRSARGERFREGKWRSHTEVWQQGYPLWIDRQGLENSEEMLDSPQGLNGYPVIGSLICLGQPISDTIIDQIRLLLSEANDQGEIGITQTLKQGLLCRYRGFSTIKARYWLSLVWHYLREILFLRSPIIPRVWGSLHLMA